jgi:hypothetical protein
VYPGYQRPERGLGRREEEGASRVPRKTSLYGIQTKPPYVSYGGSHVS